MYARMYGFRYLNSDYCSDLFDDLDRFIRVAVQQTGDKSLTEVHDSWNAVKKRRELEMIKNIRTYSREHEYHLGVFLIGAAHRRALFKYSRTRMNLKEFAGTTTTMMVTCRSAPPNLALELTAWGLTGSATDSHVAGRGRLIRRGNSASRWIVQREQGWPALRDEHTRLLRHRLSMNWYEDHHLTHGGKPA
jgi:hypothetical protein